MTVIAYRKGILAGDSCWAEEEGLIVNIQNKLVRLNSGAIYGGAGGCDDRPLLRILQNVRTPEQLPMPRDLSSPDMDDLECLLVLPDRTVWIVSAGSDSGGVCPVKLPYIAIGAGRQVAMGALAADKSAEEAVRIACDWHRTCSRPVHTMALRESDNGKRKQTTRPTPPAEGGHSQDDGNAPDLGAESNSGS